MRRLAPLSVLLFACAGELDTPAPEAAPIPPIPTAIAPAASNEVPRAPAEPRPDAQAPEAATTEAAPSPESSVPDPPKPFGDFDEWVRDFAASSAPETFRPPKLRRLEDVRERPRGTLVFLRGHHLFRLDLPSGQETRLTGGAGYATAPTWTEDGRRFFFRSNMRGAVLRPYVMHEAESTPHEVGPAMRDDALFAVARDGSRIAHAQVEKDGTTHVVITDTGTKTSRRVVTDKTDYLSFAADGASLFAVSRTFGEPAKLRRIDARTGEERALRTQPFHELVQPWDRGDGTLLLVGSAESAMMPRDPGLFTLSTRGGPLVPLGTFRVPVGYLSFELSPDKRRIAAAWSQRQGGFGAAFHEDVSVIDAASGKVVTPRATKMFPRPFYQTFAPTWAPDSRHVAMTMAVCPRPGCTPTIEVIVLVDAERPDEVPVHLADGGAPAFRPVIL